MNAYRIAPPAPPPRRPRTLVKLCLLATFVGIGITADGCSGEQKPAVVASTVIDIANAACKTLDIQDEPAWLKLTCQVIEAGSGVVKTILVRLPHSKSYAMCAAPK